MWLLPAASNIVLVDELLFELCSGGDFAASTQSSKSKSTSKSNGASESRCCMIAFVAVVKAFSVTAAQEEGGRGQVTAPPGSSANCGIAKSLSLALASAPFSVKTMGVAL